MSQAAQNLPENPKIKDHPGLTVEDVYDLIEAAFNSKPTQKDLSFVQNVAKAVQDWGPNAFLSEKQLAWLQSIARRAETAVSPKVAPASDGWGEEQAASGPSFLPPPALSSTAGHKDTETLKTELLRLAFEVRAALDRFIVTMEKS